MNDTRSVPVIDVSSFLGGSEAGKRRVAREIATACERSGFFCITGHGIDEALIARTRQAAADFFARPDAEKRRIERPKSGVGRGYYPVADRSLAYTIGLDTPPDLQEAWAMGPPKIPDDPYYHEGPATYFFGANRWPEGVPGFQETLGTYFHAVTALADRLMGAMALALDLDEDYFADKIDKPTCALRLIHYPPQLEAAKPGQLRAGEHTDYGTLTILRGDDVPGTLQVKLPDAGWTDVRPPTDAFVCNLGDAMARWTRGRWASTMHRVGNPPPEAAARGRISLVFFHQPNYDAVLGGLSGEDDGQSVTLADHFIDKIHKASRSRPPAREPTA